MGLTGCAWSARVLLRPGLIHGGSVASAHDVLDALADRGYRETQSRRLIAQAVASQISTFSARDIYGQLARLGVGRATVFRTLSLLQELGLLNRLHVGDGCDRYALC